MIKARQVSGGQYSQEDIIEIKIEGFDGVPLYFTHLTVVSISGPEVTHGGGAEEEEFLNYGFDGSLMKVSQKSKGISVIKVRAEIARDSVAQGYIKEYNDWFKRSETEGPEFNEPEPIRPLPDTFESGEITLVWEDSAYV